MTLKLLAPIAALIALSTVANAYTITYFGQGAHPAAKKPTTCSGLGRICSSMGAQGCAGFVESCKASGTWSSRSLTVTGVPKK